MPEAVLAGINGEPAIDQETGTPLTIEELLRRRGILGYKGVSSQLNSMIPANAASIVASNSGGEVVDPAAQALADATATAEASSISAVDPNLLIDASSGTGVTNNTTPVVDPAAASVAPALNPPNEMSSESHWLEWLLAAGLLGAGAYGASKLRRNPTSGVEELVPDNSVLAARADNARRVNPTVNTATREGRSLGYSANNETLDALVDGKNAARAGEVGAGPKSLSGPAPVDDVSSDNLTRAVASQRGTTALPDYYALGSQPRTRLQQGALQANQSRVQPRGSVPIQVRDRYTDLSPDEMKVTTQIAGRLMSDRKAGIGRAPNRIGSTKPRNRAIANQRIAGGPIRAPDAEANQALIEAVAIVRSLKQQGFPVTNILPRLRTVVR